MHFSDQKSYEEYYSREQRDIRLAQARKKNDEAVTEAMQLLKSDGAEAARQRLVDAGIQDDGIAYYLRTWTQNELSSASSNMSFDENLKIQRKGFTMMRLAFTLGGAAFADDNENFEIARILEDAAKKFEAEVDAFTLHDINGRMVGEASLRGDISVPDGRSIAIEMKTGNAAFEDGPEGWEIGRILREAANKVREGQFDGDLTLRDINGNTVGKLQENKPAPLAITIEQRTSATRDSSLEP